MKELKTTEDIAKLLAADNWRMSILQAVAALGLPDWWVAGGFVRSAVWDCLHNFPARTEVGDVDVVYYRPGDTEAEEITLEEVLRERLPGVAWSVTNQARMHEFHRLPRPYGNALQAISDWIEECTCVGATLSAGRVSVGAPHGVEDLVSLRVRPTKHRVAEFPGRIQEKQWLTYWPLLRVEETPR